MDQFKSAKLQQQLLTERQEVEEEIRRMSVNQLNESMSETTGELAAYDNHPGDLGSEMFERSKDLSLREGLKHQLSHIDEALQKIEAGTYGECDVCGKQIDEKRLEALPATTLCKSCREKTEAALDRYPRPIEEQVIQPPFGGFVEHNLSEEDETGEDYLMYDGEDAWQEVARYGSSETPQDVPGARNYQQMVVDANEDRGNVEDVDGIPYFRGADGMLYQDVYGQDDESPPAEIVIGDDDWDTVKLAQETKKGKKVKRVKGANGKS